jgi:3-oxoacyl-(acyl-carrier-protein) synthase
VYANAAAATQAVTVLNSLSDKPTVLAFSIDSVDERKVLCASTRAKKLNLKQQKRVRAALHNHVAMGACVAV